MREVTRVLLDAAATKSLVVALNDVSGVIDDVKAVVGLVVAAEAMRGAEHRPDPKAAGVLADLGGGVAQAVPVEPVESLEVNTGVAGQRALGEVRDARIALRSHCHLSLNVTKVDVDVGADRELTRSNFEYNHRAIMIRRRARFEPPRIGNRDRTSAPLDLNPKSRIAWFLSKFLALPVSSLLVGRPGLDPDARIERGMHVVGFVRCCRIGLWEEMWDFSANGAIENRLGSRSKLQRILERLVTLCAFVNVKCEPPRVYFPKFPKRFRFKSYSAYGLLSE